MAKRHLGVQLYTLRDMLSMDFAGTLQQVAEIGYEGVELAGFGNAANPEEAARAITANDLKVCGAHVGIEQLEKDLPGTLKAYETVGCKNIIVPWLPEDRRKDLQGWKTFAKTLNRFGKQLRKAGFALGYHNHSFEFVKLGNTTGHEILVDYTDAENVSFELDCFWVVHGGKCPKCYIHQLGKRIMTLHLKDMTDPFERKFANVGSGILNIPSIVKAGSKVKVPWFIVEQDNCYEQNPLDAVKTSYRNLQAMDLF